jgi:chromosome segregation ATPase
MANNTTTIKFVGQFDITQITKGLQDIKKQVSNANVAEDLKKQFEDAFKKLEVNIPTLEKLTNKEEFNFKDIQALQKLIKEITKDWEGLNKVTSQIDLSKTFSAKDLEKINNIDKQIKQTQDNIKKARKELVDAFSNETKISISNKNVTDALTELFTVKPNEIDSKFQEIQQQFSEGVQQTQIELENKLKGANIQKTSSQILDYFFGKDSGVEFAAKVGPVKDQLNLIIKAYREAQEKGDIAGVAEQVNKLNEVLTNTANFKFPEGYKLFGLPTEEDLDTLNKIGEMLQKVKELAKGKEVFFTEEEARLAEQMAEKLKVEAEAAKNAKDANEQYQGSVQKVGNTIKDTNDKVGDLTDAFNKIKAQTEALDATFGGLARRITSSVSALTVFNKATQVVHKAITSVKELDAAFTQIAIVSEQTNEQAWQMFDSFNKLAKQYSITTKDLTEGAKLFYQQGLSAADTMKMVEASTISAALGEVTMTEAANTLTAAIQGYNESAAVAMDYTDKIAMVGAVSAADFNELSAAMEKTASSAYTAGIDFDHLLGYLGKMIEVTREAPRKYYKNIIFSENF